MDARQEWLNAYAEKNELERKMNDINRLGKGSRYFTEFAELGYLQFSFHTYVGSAKYFSRFRELFSLTMERYRPDFVGAD